MIDIHLSCSDFPIEDHCASCHVEWDFLERAPYEIELKYMGQSVLIEGCCGLPKRNHITKALLKDVIDKKELAENEE